MIKAILFDLDGVIADSDEAIRLAINHTLEDFGFGARKKKEIFKYSGSTTKNWFKALVPKNRRRDEELLDEIVEYSTAYYRKIYPTHSKMIAYSKQVLQKLHRKGIKVALVTNEKRVGVNVILKLFGLKKYFSTLVCEGDAARGKPNPDPLLKALKNLNVKAREAVYVGDTRVDLLAGKRAGVKTFLLSNQYNKSIRAKNRLKNLMQLVEEV